MTLLISLLGLALAGSANQTANLTDLQLWECSALLGHHDHPIGVEGRRLKRAENRIEERRAALFEWLGQREGRDRLREVDQELIEQAHAVYYTAPIPTAVEWDNYRRAKRCVSELEKRRKRTGG